MGPYQGGQAQFLRVPYADFNALVLPPGKEHEADFILLADIFPTGWHGLELAGFKPGESVAVFGAGMKQSLVRHGIALIKDRTGRTNGSI
jgi:threonine dehydrogenase-like Zn-dependent dehydrogenase